DFSVSLLLVTVLFIAGRQPMLSAIIGAGLFVVLPGYVSSGSTRQYTPIIFGSLAIVAAMVGGISVVDRVRFSRRARERGARGSGLRSRRAILAPRQRAVEAGSL